MTDHLAKPPPAPGAPTSKRRPFGLRFISGKYTGGEFPLVANQEIIVGRASDLQMVLVEDMVSRRHARITISENVCFIEDLNSSNGTYVNKEQVAPGKPRQLQHGDEVRMGNILVRIEITS